LFLKEILEDALPTKWSKWSAGLTIVASPIAYILPLNWPLSMLSITNNERQMLQIMLLISTLFIGTLISLFLVIFAFRGQRKAHQTSLEEQAKCNEELKSKEEEIDKLKNQLSKISSTRKDISPGIVHNFPDPDLDKIKPRLTSGGL
jgi:hypothetical protein